jgi:predicted DCC family thiol-disulfide oxidoreductase YuxK
MGADDLWWSAHDRAARYARGWAQTGGVERPVFLFDGDCAFCTSCVRFIERHVPTRARIVAWQFADLAKLGVAPEAAEAAVQWIDRAQPVLAGPAAIAAMLVDAGSVWRPIGAVLGTRPVLWVAWPVYRWISRNRHRLPGGTAACSLSQAERERARAAVVNESL